MLYREIHLADILLIFVRGTMLFCLCKLTERHDVHHPLARNYGFSKSLHSGAGQVNEGVSAMGFSCVAVCNLQNNAAGFSVSSGQIDMMLDMVKAIPSKNLPPDVIKQIIRGIQKVE